MVIEPLCTARIAEGGDIEITVEEVEQKVVTADLDPIYLSIFSHRFMGIAEQVRGALVLYCLQYFVYATLSYLSLHCF